MLKDRGARKRILWLGLFIAAGIILGSPAPKAYAFAGDGVGSTSDPYEIFNCTQLQAIKDNLSANYELMNSIDCGTYTGFTPISGSGFFTGSFSGNNYTVNNLTINPAGHPDNVSLFGQLQGATIRDVTLNNAHISGGTAVGGIAGIVTSSATISGVHLLNSVIVGTSQVGGFVGTLGDNDPVNKPVLEYSTSKNTIVKGSSSSLTTSAIGGAVGGAYFSTIEYVATEGSVIGNDFNNSMSTQVGGIEGYGPVLVDSYSRASVVGGTYVGGLSGLAHGSFSMSYSSGDVAGDSYVGGVAGETTSGFIVNSFTDSKVTGGFPSGSIYGDVSLDVTPGVDYLLDAYFDSARSTQADCVGYDESTASVGFSGCSIGDVPHAYFFNNTTSLPFFDTYNQVSIWDFTNDWKVQASDYPILRTQPSQPVNIAVAPSLTSLAVSWDPPTNPDQAPITGYQLEYAKAGQSAMTVVPIADPATHSYTITGLSPSSQYNLRLRAINHMGNGDVVNITSFTNSINSPTLGSAPISGISATAMRIVSSWPQPAASPLQGANNGASSTTPDQTTHHTTFDTPSKIVNTPAASSQKQSLSNVLWLLGLLPIGVVIWIWRGLKTK